jgi:hypothetical protein
MLITHEKIHLCNFLIPNRYEDWMIQIDNLLLLYLNRGGSLKRQSS